MSAIYDNWERLVAATLRREELWEMFHSHSRTPSVCSSSTASDFSFSSQLFRIPLASSSPDSWFEQNRVSEIGAHGWGYDANDLEARKDNVKELAAGDIFVNGKPLSSRELIMLLRCPHPPKKLKPGNYWYDKDSGLWGKHGHKPSDIISVHLKLGGSLALHSSNGSTSVYINGREITRLELRTLQYVGVRCQQDTHFWVYEDGTYQEEGSQFIRGRIWDMAGMKLLCSLFSLPFPSKSYTSGELSVSKHIKHKVTHKLLLIGCHESGTSTIFKQAVFLYKDIPFLEHELEYIKLLIQSNTYRHLCILLEGHKQFEEEKLRESQFAEHGPTTEFADSSRYSFGPRLEAFSVWILQVTESSNSGVFAPSFIQETAPMIEEMWRSPAFQETFSRKSELQRLDRAANYFLERACFILKPNYEPSNLDILCAEQFPSSLSYVDFAFPAHEEFDMYQQDPMMRYQLIRPNGPGDNEMAFEMFQDSRIIIFCISLCDYDEFVFSDQRQVNKMIYDRLCFESTITNPVFDQRGCLLVLTKYDLFQEKIRRIPLDVCAWFDEFRPALRYNLSESGFHYVSAKFKMLYKAITGRKLYVAKMNCLKLDEVDAALRYAREIVKQGEESEYLYTD